MSVIVCYNRRIAGKVRQFTLKTLGHSSDSDQLNQWCAEGKRWIDEHRQQERNRVSTPGESAMTPSSVNVFNLREESRLNVGIHDIFGKLYDELGFHELLSKQPQETLRQVLYSRLLEPSSKLRASQIVDNYFGEEIPVDRIYRMMDGLIKSSDVIERKIFDGTERVLQGKISLVLFDVTTLSFETISEDDLRAFGFSKDFKFNTTQVVLALATTKEGLPVGYRLFPGNTAESKTLIASIEAWKNHIPIEEVTVVGDRAMMSEANLSALEAAGFTYVVAFPLKKLTKKHQALVLDKECYHSWSGDEEISRYRILELGQRNLVVSFSQKRAMKDQKDRERAVNKLEKKLSTCKDAKRLINTKGYLKYTAVSGQATASINQEKIAQEAQWDGLHGVITNREVTECNVYQDYRRLWIIEESFRINKHNLKMRPIYHFTPRRIQAHILICYMAFTLVRHVQYHLNKTNNAMSVKRIIEALRNVQASILKDVTSNKSYRMLSSLSDDARIIYENFGVQQSKAVAQVS